MTQQANKATTGIVGLDDILQGGLSRGHVFLVEGEPGAGKTTIALQFLLEGAKAGENSLYITLSETEEELRQGAASHGWTLGPEIKVFELIPPESLLDAEQQQSLLYSSDLELGETTRQIFDAVERVKPARVVLDSLSEIRLLAQSSLRYRRQILAIKHYFARHGATVLMLDDLTAEAGDKTVHSVAHGVVHLEQLAPAYGAERRRIRILKYRGQRYRGGYHDFTITTGGVNVFPRLVAAEHITKFDRKKLSTDLNGFDLLLGGGIESGSSTLVLGPAGTGKSLVVMTFVMAAIARGEKAALFIFDEELRLLFDRMKAMGIDLEGARDRGDIILETVDAAELSPGEFAHRVRKTVATQPHQDGGDRQPQRLSGRDAGREFSHPSHARIVAVSEPPRCGDVHDGGAARPGRRYAISRRRDLSGRRCDSASLFRSGWEGATGNFGYQEAHRVSREYDP